jgi:hypothetical protein
MSQVVHIASHGFGTRPRPLVVGINELDAAFTLWSREYRRGKIGAAFPPPLLGQRNDPLHGEKCRALLLEMLARLGNKDAAALAARK